MTKVSPNIEIKINKEHDKIFKLVLENKEALAELLNRQFVLKGKNKIKKEELEEYKTEYITKELNGKQADKVFKIKNKEIYFLIEHQSKIDKNMPNRILEYKFEIKRDVEKKTKGKANPKIIALVIYSGKEKWKVATKIEEVQEKFKGINQEFGEYNLLSGREENKKNLLESNNLILQLLLLEKAETREELYIYLRSIIPKIKKEDLPIIINIAETAYAQKLGREKINEILKNIRKKGDDNMLALVEMMRKQAEEERRIDFGNGRKEGIKTRNKNPE